jgi:hypothetical protein
MNGIDAMTKKNANKVAARALKAEHGGSYERHLRNIGGAKAAKPKPAQWICDTCGEVIKCAKDGWLEWFRDDESRRREFRICHHFRASPLRKGEERGDGCYRYSHKRGRGDDHLEHFMGAEGLAYFLSFLDVGPVHGGGQGVASPGEWAEIFRRLYVRDYEEARQYFAVAERDGFYEGANELWPYMPENLKLVISRYEVAEDGEVGAADE